MEKAHSQCLTLILQSFKAHGGIDAIRCILELFLDEVKRLSSAASPAENNLEESERLASAYGGIQIILTFFTQITASKCVVESTQSQSIASHDRDREQAYYFLPAQFLVELRMCVLPVVKSMWDSDFADKASNSILKTLIEILKTVLDGELEIGALRRSDKAPVRNKAQFKVFNIPTEKENVLKGKGYDQALVREALYRCLNNREWAEEYCKAHRDLPDLPRIPQPSYDQEKAKTPSPPRTPQRQDSEATIPDAENALQPEEVLPAHGATGSSSEADAEVQEAAMEESTSSLVPAPSASGWPSGTDGDDGDNMAMSIDNLLSITDLLHHEIPINSEPSSSKDILTSPIRTDESVVVQKSSCVTIDDLEDERSAVRGGLIDRALGILNIHGDVTFELSDLITVSAAKAPDAITMRREIGATLVQSLISFQTEEDFRPSGKKIAAYANLLALVLQEKEFYDATLDELKDSLSSLFGFIKTFPNQGPEEPSPWVGQILLVIEKLLGEDVQPTQIKWTPPDENSQNEDVIAELSEPLLTLDEKTQLFEAITQILTSIGKDESLALSVVRVLVILSRDRTIATKLAEKHNLQRLFLMVKQLAGITNEKLQGSIMLVLRHIIEDDDTIRQIMRVEIVTNFEPRTSRAIDTTGYVRSMYHLVLRSPSIFVEVTNEKLKLSKFDPSQRPQVLTLKPVVTVAKSSTSILAQAADDTGLATDTSVIRAVRSSTDGAGTTSSEKLKNHESKTPVVEHPDGVIHYLLSQLLSYKDVPDKDLEALSKDPTNEAVPTSPTDIEMSNGSGSMTPNPAMSISDKKVEKLEFKAEQHPIYIYRCFLLQCLTELLSSYNQCKIEFINFSRKADPKAVTPSKPRSGVLSYLLNALIPVGTLNHEDSIAFRKKSITSNWAMSTIVSLCLKTGEKGYDGKRVSSEDEHEPELLFVRKFVLEHALKAYKDANASKEPLDIKYARLLSIADLFNRMLSGRFMAYPGANASDSVASSQKELARIMFEKNFISAFTSSIADIDLNFPNSKRTVKYILKPLKVLTHTAIVLSETSSLSTTPGQTDDDEISTASSVSDIGDEREETPDLFRHSTLGMLEPNREAESSSESSDEDEDMYDDEYDEGIEYEEEMERDGDEVISDEDEEIEGAGPLEGLSGDVGMDVEVMIEGEDDEASDEDDPDDSEDMDDGLEVIDEINGDDENDSLVDGDEEEWQDEDDEAGGFGMEGGIGIDSGQAQDHDSAVRDLVRDMQNATGTLPGLDDGDLQHDIENEIYMDEAVHEEDGETCSLYPEDLNY